MTKEANLRDFVLGSARKTAQLAPDKERESEPNMPQTGDFANTPFRGSGAFEREEPPKDHMRRYWRQYETTPMVREPINSFASQVIEPGYWIESENLSEDEVKQLEKWMRKAAIMEKEPEKDILHMLKKAVVQREVRGTALIQKVYAKEDSEKLYGLAFMNAETVRPNTQPGTPLLLMPDDAPADFEKDGELPETEDGKTAAYTQYTTDSGFGVNDPNSEDVNNFTFDDVIKLTRDADVNEAFGTSRLEACSDVIEGLKQKMLDQNEAIASKAYPLWLFMFGSEDRPWDREDIQRFMNAHEMENFHPGLKQGVRGDVSIETISGEVAEVVDYLEFDINYIMSAMPMPKYILGGFESNINQFVSRTQERAVNRQIKEARNELEAEFSEVIQQKCMELFSMNQEDAEEVFFRLGRPNEEMIDENPQVNTINYQGKGDGTGPQGNNSGQNNTNQYGVGGDGTGRNGVPDDPSYQQEQQDVTPTQQSVWDVELEEVEGINGAEEELADPRLVSTRDVENDLANVIETVMERFRNRIDQRIREEYEGASYAASMAFEDMANQVLNEVLASQLTDGDDGGFDPIARTIMIEVLRRLYRQLPDLITGRQANFDFGLRQRRAAESYAQSTQRAVRDALEAQIRRMDRTLSNGANNGEDLNAILDRMAGAYSEDQLRSRSRLIARMEIQNALETTKLEEFESEPTVAGVKVINPCSQHTTRLCKGLAGCGGRSQAVARFDSDKSVSEQLMEQTTADLYQGFNPLPVAPPFHWNCRSELVPVSEEELEDALGNRPVTTVEALEEKYGMK